MAIAVDNYESISSFEKERILDELRIKITKLESMRKVIAHMQTLCKNSDGILSTLNVPINNINTIASAFEIPQYKSLFVKSLDGLSTNGGFNNGLKRRFTALNVQLPKAGQLLDQELSKTAKEIERVKNIPVEDSRYSGRGGFF